MGRAHTRSGSSLWRFEQRKQEILEVTALRRFCESWAEVEAGAEGVEGVDMVVMVLVLLLVLLLLLLLIGERRGNQQENVAGSSAQTERDEDYLPTPSSDDDDEGENPQGDDERALRCTLEAIQKKCRIVTLQRQIEVE